MTGEEYNKRLNELRKERDFHQGEYKRLMREMDILASDRLKVDVTIGKYIKINRCPTGGYITYFHVDTYKDRPRGVTIYGRGFYNSRCNVGFESQETILWDEVDLIEEVTEQEFFAAFDEYVDKIKQSLKDFKDYKVNEDSFDFKDRLINASINSENEILEQRIK